MVVGIVHVSHLRWLYEECIVPHSGSVKKHRRRKSQSYILKMLIYKEDKQTQSPQYLRQSAVSGSVEGSGFLSRGDGEWAACCTRSFISASNSAHRPDLQLVSSPLRNLHSSSTYRLWKCRFSLLLFYRGKVSHNCVFLEAVRPNDFESNGWGL